MRRSNTFRLAVSALFAAVIYLCSFVVIPLPFSPVPVTAHTLALTLACLILPRRESVWAVIGYLLAGLATGTVGFGLAVGYDVGFLLTALFVPVLRGEGKFGRYLAVSVLAALVTDLCGAAGMLLVGGMDLSAALLSGFAVFLPGDLCKAFAAASAAVSVGKAFRRLCAGRGGL